MDPLFSATCGERNRQHSKIEYRPNNFFHLASRLRSPKVEPLHIGSGVMASTDLDGEAHQIRGLRCSFSPKSVYAEEARPYCDGIPVCLRAGPLLTPSKGD